MSDWMAFPTVSSCKREQVGDEVLFPLDMLRRQAVALVMEERCKMACGEAVCFVGWSVAGRERRQWRRLDA